MGVEVLNKGSKGDYGIRNHSHQRDFNEIMNSEQVIRAYYE